VSLFLALRFYPLWIPPQIFKGCLPSWASLDILQIYSTWSRVFS
jgi:hypothetical protein